jgi:hypothetical protein
VRRLSTWTERLKATMSPCGPSPNTSGRTRMLTTPLSPSHPPATSASVRSTSSWLRVASPNPMRRTRWSSARRAGRHHACVSRREVVCCCRSTTRCQIHPALLNRLMKRCMRPPHPPSSPPQKASTNSGACTRQSSSRPGSDAGWCTCRARQGSGGRGGGKRGFTAASACQEVADSVRVVWCCTKACTAHLPRVCHAVGQ